jgi:predicted transcriptional regulator
VQRQGCTHRELDALTAQYRECARQTQAYWAYIGVRRRSELHWATAKYLCLGAQLNVDLQPNYWLIFRPDRFGDGGSGHASILGRYRIVARRKRFQSLTSGADKLSERLCPMAQVSIPYGIRLLYEAGLSPPNPRRAALADASPDQLQQIARHDLTLQTTAALLAIDSSSLDNAQVTPGALQDIVAAMTPGTAATAPTQPEPNSEMYMAPATRPALTPTAPVQQNAGVGVGSIIDVFA